MGLATPSDFGTALAVGPHIDKAGRDMKSYAEYLGLLEADDASGPDVRELDLLAGAMLDGGVPDLELGALLGALARRADSALLLQALLGALDRRVTRWGCAGPTPVVIGCYGGSRDCPNLSPLLALLLARFEIPVLMHGPLHAKHGLSAALVLRELGIMPCAHKEQVERELAERHIAFAPDALLAPGLAALLALRARLGPLSLLVTAARLIDPFDAGALVMTGGDTPEEIGAMARVLAGGEMRVLLLHGSGDGCAHPLRRPRMEYWQAGEATLLFEGEPLPPRHGPALPPPLDSGACAAWIREACEGTRPVPMPIVNQLAAALHAAGYCSDFNQAKALAAIAATRRQVA